MFLGECKLAGSYIYELRVWLNIKVKHRHSNFVAILKKRNDICKTIL